MTTDSKFNVGQYGFKPWMANLVMGLLEFVLIIVWFLGSLLTGLSSMLSLDIKVMEAWDVTTSLILAGALLAWNLLVWCIKPLRTKWNNIEAKYNIAFIAWLIISLFLN